MLAFRKSFTVMQARLACPVVYQPSRLFANWEEKQRGEEKSYFSKKDAKLL